MDLLVFDLLLIINDLLMVLFCISLINKLRKTFPIKYVRIVVSLPWNTNDICELFICVSIKSLLVIKWRVMKIYWRPCFYSIWLSYQVGRGMIPVFLFFHFNIRFGKGSWFECVFIICHFIHQIFLYISLIFILLLLLICIQF